MAFSDCLKINKTLKEFDISHNKIKHEEEIAIEKALRMNTTLQRLYISCHETSVIAFCEYVKDNNNTDGVWFIM